MLAEPWVVAFDPKPMGIRSERHPPPTTRGPEGLVDEPSINVSCPDQCTEVVPEVTDHSCGAVWNMRGLYPVSQREEDFKLVPGKALGVPVIRDPVHLFDSTCTPLESELAVDRQKGDGEHDPAQGRPEPLRA